MGDVEKVFISSTAKDLPEHRGKVMHACLRQSLTEMEYERAIERGMPRLVFLMGDEHDVKAKDIEKGEGGARLDALRQRSRGRDPPGRSRSDAQRRRGRCRPRRPSPGGSGGASTSPTRRSRTSSPAPWPTSAAAAWRRSRSWRCRTGSRSCWRSSTGERVRGPSPAAQDRRPAGRPIPAQAGVGAGVADPDLDPALSRRPANRDGAALAGLQCHFPARALRRGHPRPVAGSRRPRLAGGHAASHPAR